MRLSKQVILFILAAGMLTGCATAVSKKYNYPDADKLSCDQESTLRSQSGESPTEIVFVNDSDEAVVVRWLNYDGERDDAKKQILNLFPNSSIESRTFMTHPFVFTNKQGDCLAVYLPREVKTAAIHR